MTFADIKDGLTTAGMALAAGFTLLSPAAVAWLGKTFASKAKVDELAQRMEEMDKRLAQGETRFVQLDAAIREACQAARDAKTAADEVAVAAEKVQETEVALARLEEQIRGLSNSLKNVEHFTRLMLEGHMKMGAGS